MKIKVDNKTYPSKKKALVEFEEAMCFCEGSEGERMTFAYTMIKAGYCNINTYAETASKTL